MERGDSGWQNDKRTCEASTTIHEREGLTLPPNLFDFATKELSQDALICWLLKWAEDDSDYELHALGRAFAKALLNHKSQREVELPKGPFRVETHQQDGGIDVLARVDCRHVLLIEDKTGSGVHGDQLRRYRNYVLGRQDDGKRSKLGTVSERDVHPIFFKTGNQSLSAEREIEGKDGYRVFTRRDWLDVLRRYEGNNPIVLDAREYWEDVEAKTNSYGALTRPEWDGAPWEAWEGLYRRLEEELFGDDTTRWRGWGYVPNPSGGFVGFWWQPAAGLKGKGGEELYLQTEWHKLCFKVGHAKAEHQDEIKWHWHKRLMEAGRANSSDERIVKPPVMRRGDAMTVALWRTTENDDSWMSFGASEKLDVGATVERLRTAEQVWLEAARCG